MVNLQTPLFPHFDSEDLRHEFKTCASGVLQNDIWKSISAFANTEGGQIVLGVTPEQQPIGLSSTEIDKLQQDFLSLCQTSFNYPIVPDIQVIGTIINAYIPPAPAAVRPIYSKKRGIPHGAYVRIGSSNIQVTNEILSQFASAANGGSELIEYRNLNYNDCFDFSIVDNYIELVNAARGGIYHSVARDEILRKMRAITESEHPTLFGMLVFSKDILLQEVTASTTNIAITQYATDSKVDPRDPTITFIDDREFNGNVLQQFEQASRFIRSKLPIKGVIDQSGKRQEFLSIPEVAIREALANAITHRDYGTYASRIQVDIYSNRIEIINPGQSLVPIESIDNTASVSRNPTLMGFLKDYHITEQRARGIRTIRDSLRAAGLPEPVFSNSPISFSVTLYNSAFMSSEDHDWLKQFKKFRLNERQLTALNYLHNDTSGLSNSEYRAINNMNSVGDDRRAHHELDRLVLLGVILPVGENRHRKYLLKEQYDA